MSITPQLEDTLAGKYTKEISDFLALDVKDSKGVLETLRRLEVEAYNEGVMRLHNEDTDD